MNSPADIIKKKPYLAWHVADLENLSDEVVLEQVLNFGDWEDVQDYIGIRGMEKTAEIFSKTKSKNRSNYRPEISHYFSLFFKTHAPEYSQFKTN